MTGDMRESRRQSRERESKEGGAPQEREEVLKEIL